jgi:hypothetical protein
VRARTKIGRLEGGLLWAFIELPPVEDHAGLLPHEFEHVIEQIEKLDLAAMVSGGEGEVVIAADRSFETRRARSPGGRRRVSSMGTAIIRTSRRPCEASAAVCARSARAAQPGGWASRMRAGAHKEF